MAGSIGRLCLAIFADGTADEIYPLADDLGVAMQLTNILRDIVEDRELGRMYLPAEDRRRFGCLDLANADEHAVVELIRFEAERADEWFDRGLRMVDHAGRPQRLVRAGDDRDLPADPRSHPRGPGASAARADLALAAREVVGRGAQPRGAGGLEHRRRAVSRPAVAAWS